MLDVFRDSGFMIRSKSAGGVIDVELSLVQSASGVLAHDQREHTAAAASIRPLLAPTSVAVVGVSRDRDRIGRRIWDAVLAAGYRGPVYPVTTSAADIDGIQAYRSVRDLPLDIDLVVIAVPQPAILDVIDDCAAARVRSVVVITAGFAETGSEGRARQADLLTRVRSYGMRMVGPNCMGLLNTAVHLNASFSPIMPPEGRVALSSQSGALGLAILSLAAARGLGLSTFVSVGNKADVSGNDLLQYWEDDPSTSVILLYLESFGNPAGACGCGLARFAAGRRHTRDPRARPQPGHRAPRRPRLPDRRCATEGRSPRMTERPERQHRRTKRRRRLPCGDVHGRDAFCLCQHLFRERWRGSWRLDRR
jgi:predicted CoA-binding protein